MQPEEFQSRFEVSRETIDKLQIYAQLLTKWQGAINLVGPSTLSDIWGRHFADSAVLLKHIHASSTIADIGSGAGFPGLVLALCRPEIKIDLIEADERKAQFLRTVSRETNIPVTIHSVRAESVLAGIEPDLITARAFASLSDILKLGLNQNFQGRYLLLKGKNYQQEIEEAQKKYGFEIESHHHEIHPESRILLIKNVTKRNH